MSIEGLINVRKAITSLNPRQVREMTAETFSVALHAPTQAAHQQMQEFFLQELKPSRRRESAALLSDSDTGRSLAIYHEGIAAPPNALVYAPARPELLVRKTLAQHPHLGVSLAKSFVPFRKPFVNSVISRTARENTLFSLATALPDIIPSVIELPWAVAEFASDTAFLTMNQVRMAFLVAAASDREVGYMEQKSEIAAVIGSAFGWRAIARQLVGKIPFGGGLIAKAGVAYAGTKVLGLSLEQFYSIGFTFSREERQTLYADAFRQGKNVATRILSLVRPDIAAKLAGRESARQAASGNPKRASASFS